MYRVLEGMALLAQYLRYLSTEVGSSTRYDLPMVH